MCTQLGLCISSNHFQVAERALYLFNNLRFVVLLDQNVNELMSVLIGLIIHRCIWVVPSLTSLFDPQTHMRGTANKLFVLTSMDPQFVSQCTTYSRGSLRCFNLAAVCFILFHSVSLTGLSKDKPAPAVNIGYDRASCAFSPSFVISSFLGHQ